MYLHKQGVLLMIISQENIPTVSGKRCVETLKNDGALLLQGFVPTSEQHAITDEILSHELTEVDRTGHTIPEQFRDIGWEFRQSPHSVFRLGRRIGELVRPHTQDWFINQVRAQLYSPGEVGIEWHRDYKRDLRIIAVASFMTHAAFDIELDSGTTTWDLAPGDVVLMRGALLNGTQDDRPRHRVAAPISDQRLSVAYRQVTRIVPDLEPTNG